METSEARGRVYGVDHYVVCTNDVNRWERFHETILGAVEDGRGGFGLFQRVGRTRHGGFIAKKPLPPSKGLGVGLPRYAFYIEQADIASHLARLKANGVPHSEPERASAEGANGVAVYWQDPDFNQFEFWAPDQMPYGAMVGCSPLGVGCISHAVLESRDLDRTAVLFHKFCGLEALTRPEIATDTLVLPLGSGGRLVYRKVEELGRRTSGCGLPDAHTALLVRNEDFLFAYDRMWAALPEWDWDVTRGETIDDLEALPSRTALHPSQAGRRFKELTGRGDDWYDWDTNSFHFFGGTPVSNSMAVYRGHAIDHYFEEWKRRRAENSAVLQNG